MRIDESLSGQAVQESKQSNGPKSVGRDDAFALLLQSEIQGQGQGQEIAPDGSISEPASLPGLWGTQAPVPNSAQSPELSQALSAIDGVLTQFDSLQNALQEGKSPKQINALIEQLNTQTAGLDDKMSGLPADHQLKGLSEELKVTAYMESLKWKRGDYL